MSKIGRNDPCPCGSGKKYKNCHLKSDEPLPGDASNNDSLKIDFNDLLRKYNSKQILGMLSALQLHAENHGRNFRFEQLCRETLLHFDPADNKPLAPWELIKEVIESYTEHAYMEDPLTNPFTEIAIYEEGNYLVFSGLYSGFTRVLNHLLECIFLMQHEFPEGFKKSVRDAAGLLLFMSDSAGRDAGHEPYIFKERETDNIEVPPIEKVQKYRDANLFPRDYLVEVCEKRGYNINILDEFVINIKDEQLNNDDPDANLVNFKPLVGQKDSILLYMPGGVLNALIHFIYEMAKEHKCYSTLLEALYERQFDLACAALTNAGWLRRPIELPPSQTPISTQEAVFQFDNQKLAYVCFLRPGMKNDTSSGDSSAATAGDTFMERADEICKHLARLHPHQPFGIFCLYIIGESAQDFYFMWSKPSAGNQSMALQYSDLWTILHADKVNGMTLWKFAKCYSRTNEIARIMPMTSPMDAYAIYRVNHGSLLHSDRENPKGGSLFIVNGSADEFTREVQRHQNEHAVPIFNQRQLAYAKVTRYRDYAPIYQEKEVSKSLRIVIENYKMPIWITNPQSKANKETWGTYVCEAIAFWLNKMTPLLAPYLEKQTLIQFEIEVFVAEEMLKNGEFIIKEIPVESIEIPIEIDAPVIRMKIPFDFVYAVILPDNTADKLLLKTVLRGIVQYIGKTKKSTDLNDQLIDDIIEKSMQPSNAKMLLFSDSSNNIRLDLRGLPPIRYVNDTDVSYILDNLVSYLPEDYKIPKDIPDIKDKIKLCDDIVLALIAQIESKIATFDGPMLLEWLIKHNEKCVQFKEFQEILIPAKIACFSSFQQEVNNLMDGEANMVITGHAVRTLIEWVASKIATGTKWPNFDDVDELLALTNQLTEWGALSESIRMKLDDPKMGLLPSGRIGVDKTLEREAFKPYAIAKTESAIFQHIEHFESNYVSRQKTGKTQESAEAKALNAAFKAEFGMTLSALYMFIGALVDEGFTKGGACIKFTETELTDILRKVKGLDEMDIATGFSMLTLLERNSIGEPPSGYNSLDIFPWRYNRPISYLRRPLVKVSKDGVNYYYYGYRHLIQYIDNLNYLLHTSKLAGVKSAEMKGWLASVSSDKGTPFRDRVKKWFESNSSFEVVPHEVKMDINVASNHVKTDRPYGDIDLMVIDHGAKIIYPIECKNIEGGRNVHEMKIEMDEYLGRDGKDKKAKMRKHVERDQYLSANKNSLAGIVKSPEDYTLKSFVLTADEIPLAYLKKDDLPLPVKSFTFLRKNGISYLSDL